MKTSIVDGFKAYDVESDLLSVRIVPELGAKVISFRDRISGREWMWRPPDVDRLFASPTGSAFAAGTKWGADECIPTIAACPWRGRQTTDHGEAWTEAWNVDASAEALVTSLRLPITPLQIERTAEVKGPRLRLAYRLENVGSEPCEYLWALHPLIAIRDGDSLVLPPGPHWRWPDRQPIQQPLNLARGETPDAVKFFVFDPTEGVASVENNLTGDFLRFSFDPASLTTLGIWINRGAWGGYHHMAIEPTTGAPDALDDAVNTWHRFSALQPGETRTWEITIETGSLGTGKRAQHN